MLLWLFFRVKNNKDVLEMSSPWSW